MCARHRQKIVVQGGASPAWPVERHRGRRRSPCRWPGSTFPPSRQCGPTSWRPRRRSISAEHGIGVIKKEFLRLARSDAELELMRSLKAVLDPVGILNAGRVFA
ncbi:hypothetical protein EJI01_05650 [Variovorax sp. MHTC-1]|nr:hypothetical protein EJI01_05650 [Variovorax sp. MHTC-1]